MNKFIRNYASLLFCSAFLGAQLIALNLGFFQLSPYRALLIFAPFVLIFMTSRRKYEVLLKKNKLYIFFFSAWVVYSFLNLFWVLDTNSYFLTMFFLVSGYFSSLIIGLHVVDFKQFFKLFKFVEYFSAFVIIISFYEVYTGNYLFVNEENRIFYDEKSTLYSNVGLRVPITIFGNPNNLALYISYAITISFSLFLVHKKKIYKIISFLILISLIIVSFLTQSRSGLIGIILFFLIYYISDFSLRKFIFFIFFIFFALTVFTIFFSESYEYIGFLMSFDVDEGSDYVRINLLKNAFLFLDQSFYFGIGLGNFEYYMSYFKVYDTLEILNVHNWWMEILVSSGIFIFFGYIFNYVSLVFYLFKISKRKFSSYEHRITFKKTFACFLVSFAIVSVGASSVMSTEWMWPAISSIYFFSKV